MARRVIVVLVDGLRPELVAPQAMPSLFALSREYTRADLARTVRPSVTVAALASLATGVSPATHRLTEPGLGFLPTLSRLRPIAHELGRRGISTMVACASMGPGARSVAWALLTAAGVGKLVVGGSTPRDVAAAATQDLNGPGFTVVYLPHCDRAGHASGWMSPAYREAAAAADEAIGLVVERSRDALIVVVSDHGGGGIRADDHDEVHPLNELIPLVLAGPGVRRGQVLAREASILDVPATILWHFGLPVPDGYEGRVLEHAFVRAPAMAVPL
jgi:predicted AlkP superfamily pyrophosphatase or phosphodiesterase